MSSVTSPAHTLRHEVRRPPYEIPRYRGAYHAPAANGAFAYHAIYGTPRKRYTLNKMMFTAQPQFGNAVRHTSCALKIQRSMVFSIARGYAFVSSVSPSASPSILRRYTCYIPTRCYRQRLTAAAIADRRAAGVVTVSVPPVHDIDVATRRRRYQRSDGDSQCRFCPSPHTDLCQRQRPPD